ncbi:hypothetical protein ACJIZ3_009097 [Penstemon smallii]|uniref:Uncharacterized protein n=1 Tax=Penstemon smallii TaxID=265156 RepID=A0ABD3TCN1_9LAMI
MPPPLPSTAAGIIIVSVSFSEISLSFNLGFSTGYFFSLSFQSHDSTFSSEVVSRRCYLLYSMALVEKDDPFHIGRMKFMKLESKPADFQTDGNNIRFH